MSSSGTPVGLGYGDFRDRDGRVSSIHRNPKISVSSFVFSEFVMNHVQATAIGAKLPQFPPVPHAVHSVSRGHLVAQQNIQPPNMSLSQKLTERIEHWFGMSIRRGKLNSQLVYRHCPHGFSKLFRFQIEYSKYIAL